MAQVVVDSSVMRDKAKTLENAAVTIQSLYAEMLQEVTTTANKMKGTTIETEKKQFANILLILLSRTLRHTAHSSPRLLKVMKLLSVKALRKLRSRAKSSDFLEA